MKMLQKASLFILVTGSSIGPVIGTAYAQQFNRPWGFAQQNRAQMAVVMRQIENGDSGSVAGSAGGGGGTTIVCGGGSATATANNTCVILNNSTGQIATDQLSDGDQTASNSSSSTTNTVTESVADEVLSTLNSPQ